MSLRSAGFLLSALVVVAIAASPQTAPAGRHGSLLIQGGVLERTLLTRIQNEPDDSNRLFMMRDFAAAFPRSKSLLWILESIQNVHLARKDYRAAMDAGDRVLKLFPADIDTAMECLKAAETISDFEAVRRYAAETWKRASWLRGRTDDEGEAARRAMDYAEAALATLAFQSASVELREIAMQSLVRLNPESLHLPTALDSTADRSAGSVMVRTGPSPRLDVKNNPFSPDLENVDVLVAEAERLTRRGDNYWKVLDYSRRALNKLQIETEAPANIDFEVWKARQDRLLTAARWMSGIAATILGFYGPADRDLRAALPAIRTNRPALGLTLYSLGYVNYRLAEEGDRKRIFDALRFNRECSTIPGPYRDQALRNIETIKIFYNMK